MDKIIEMLTSGDKEMRELGLSLLFKDGDITYRDYHTIKHRLHFKSKNIGMMLNASHINGIDRTRLRPEDTIPKRFVVIYERD